MIPRHKTCEEMYWYMEICIYRMPRLQAPTTQLTVPSLTVICTEYRVSSLNWGFVHYMCTKKILRNEDTFNKNSNITHY